MGTSCGATEHSGKLTWLYKFTHAYVLFDSGQNEFYKGHQSRWGYSKNRLEGRTVARVRNRLENSATVTWHRRRRARFTWQRRRRAGFRKDEGKS